MGDATSEFRALVAGGELVGHVGGRGPELLILHGGPVSNYLEPLAAELRDEYRVATYQQRGLDPSTPVGPFDVATHVADVVAVLDHLGWERPMVGGHSWGGHLLLHLLATHVDRVAAALAIDPLGAVGDGGYPASDAEMLRRTPEDQVKRAAALDERVMAGATLQSAVEELPALAGRLAGSPVPTVFVHGGASPMPVTASTDTAEVIGASASVVVVPDAGHFSWMDAPGCLRQPLSELAERTVRAS